MILEVSGFFGISTGTRDTNFFKSYTSSTVSFLGSGFISSYKHWLDFSIAAGFAVGKGGFLIKLDD